MCDGKNHNLKIIYRHNRQCDNGENVVRWCKDCGSVVVDIDVDNRTVNAGGVVKMEHPTGDV